ncbi:MAG: class I SAM-dependent methyltransferase [Mailhella sp.]|nr:class I SAM-dependent methyltransferase [Mailhella sp.]
MPRPARNKAPRPALYTDEAAATPLRDASEAMKRSRRGTPFQERHLSAENLRALLARNGFGIDGPQLAALTEYLSLLVKWNRSINLVGKASWKEIAEELVIDSFHLKAFLDDTILPDYPVREVWDLGAGAGLPGIPLRILWDGGKYVLVELREKRSLFLATVLTRLGLGGTDVFAGDAKLFMSGRLAEGHPADIILSRAFMPPAGVMEFTRPFLRANGVLILMSNTVIDEADGSPWSKKAEKEYAVKGKKRFLTALEKH